MSADNWEICPRCLHRRGQDIAAAEQRVTESYGKVPVAEFDVMRAEVAAKREAKVERTFREDYEMGLDGDEFYVVYKGGCRECGLTHEFRHIEVLRVTEGGAA